MISEKRKLLNKGSSRSWPSCSLGTLVVGGVLSRSHSPTWPTAMSTPRTMDQGTVISLMLCQTSLHRERKLDTGFASSSADQLHLFQGWFKGNGTFETQGYNFTQVKISHSPMRVLGSSFSQDNVRSPLLLATEKFRPSNSPMTASVMQLLPCFYISQHL